MVPSVSYELHKKLLSVAEKHGLTLERRLEMTGVCASQMALTLLGGPNRYMPLAWWGLCGVLPLCLGPTTLPHTRGRHMVAARLMGNLCEVTFLDARGVCVPLL